MQYIILTLKKHYKTIFCTWNKLLLSCLFTYWYAASISLNLYWNLHNFRNIIYNFSYFFIFPLLLSKNYMPFFPPGFIWTFILCLLFSANQILLLSPFSVGSCIPHHTSRNLRQINKTFAHFYSVILWFSY